MTRPTCSRRGPRSPLTPPRARRGVRVGLALLASLIALAPVGCKKGSSPTGPGPGPGGGSDATPTEVVRAAYGAGFAAAREANDAIDAAIEAVFVASGLNGGSATFTGTLRVPTGGSVSYSPDPTDRLIVDADGFPEIDIRVASFEGYVGGTWEDFRDAHTDLEVTVSVDGRGTLALASAAGAPTGRVSPDDLDPAARIRTVDIERAIRGTLVVDGATVDLDLVHRGRRHHEFSGGVLSFESEETVRGTASSGGGAIDVVEDYAYVFYDDRSVDVQNLHRRTSSTVVTDGVTYAFDDVYVRSEHVNYAINQPEYWLAQGRLLRDGVAIGEVRFNAPVLIGTAGPEAILDLGAGGTILLGGVLAE